MRKLISLIIVFLMVVSTIMSCCGNPPIDPTKITDIQTHSGRHLPYEVNNNIPTIDLNYYEDYDIGTILSENKQMVSHWFWMWLVFTLLLCGATELVGYIPYGVGVVFKFLGKRLSSLALAIVGFFFIKWIMGGGWIFTSSITLLSLVSANLGWELLINWLKLPNIYPKIKSLLVKKK